MSDLRWTGERPKVSGFYWFWEQDDTIKPEIVRVHVDKFLDAAGMGPTMQWVGLTRRRNVRHEFGLWAGPLEAPDTTK